MNNKHTIEELHQMQSLPLSVKIRMTQQRIRAWINEFGENGVYVSFSGGKDSTVLLDIVRKDYPNVKAVFINTGLEYPSVRRFALSKENVEELRPKMNFRDVIVKYGYPVINKEVAQTVYEAQRSVRSENGKYTYRLKKLDGTYVDKEGNLSSYNIPQWKYLLKAPFNISHKCCDVMKKSPAKKYEKDKGSKGIIATMADESRLRKEKWIRHGCNAFDLKRPQSTPMSFWTENDILTYIHTYNLAIADAYGQVIAEHKKDYQVCKYKTTGCKRTGCVFCLFGIKQDSDRIARLQIKEPKLADYVLRGGEFGNDGYWQPDNRGLGYWFVIDWLNLHGLRIEYYKDIDYARTYGNERTRKILLQEKIKTGMKQKEKSDWL